MTRTTMFFVPATLIMSVATGWVTVQTSLAEPAVNECKTKPDSSAPAGSHWYYRVNRADQRHCWYLGPEGATVRSQARDGASRVSRPAGTAARENPPETTQAMPPPMETARRITAETASIPMTKDFAAPSPDPARAPDLTTPEPTPISNSQMENHEPADAQEEMPLIWPILTEADRAGLADTVREFAPWPALLVGTLALLLAGAVFKLVRRHTQSSRRDQRQTGRLRTRQKRRAYSAHMAARPDQVARRSALRTQGDDTVRQRPTSIDPVEATTLRELMRDLQRAAA